MGVTDFTQIYYDLSSLITALPMEQLNLDSDFTEDESLPPLKICPITMLLGLMDLMDTLLRIARILSKIIF